MTRATAAGIAPRARELAAWFESLSALCAQAFDWGRGPHGDASSLHVLRQQAARLRTSQLGERGASYTPLCVFLAAASRSLGLRLTTRHWSAALRNVIEQRRAPLDPSLGVELGSPAERFKLLLDDAIEAAGLGVGGSDLDAENRRLALGLAVNWGMRTLLAYAAETKFRRVPGDSQRHDLAWLRARVLQAQ